MNTPARKAGIEATPNTAKLNAAITAANGFAINPRIKAKPKLPTIPGNAINVATKSPANINGKVIKVIPTPRNAPSGSKIQ